ncbi:MAG: hypothetical protein JXR78_14935 [Victivallales bacterium]|nr:hypothetical protein [Victivallales bacterium]
MKYYVSGSLWSKFTAMLFVCVVSAMSSFAGEPSQSEIRRRNQYVEYHLAQGEIYKIYVKMNDGVTTVQFPSAITEIAGKNISVDGQNSDFQIAARPGAYYFSVTALSAGATGTLTVNYNRQLYILYLIQSDEKAYASVVFGGTSGNRNHSSPVVSRTPEVTPARLASLIDITRKYEILKEAYPEILAGTERTEFQSRYRCVNYELYLDEAVRFEDEDTVIFRLRLVNLTSEEIQYDRYSFSAYVGNRIYYMSISDASGIMPPNSQTYAWFGITSTPYGGRNNLSSDNDWLIALTTREAHLNNLPPASKAIQEEKESSKVASDMQEYENEEIQK